MTVTYTAEVATCTKFGCFMPLLFRWRGSIYKLIYLDLVLFLGLYYTCTLLYRFVLNDYGKMIFEGIATYCHNYGGLIPLSFVLGFFISVIMERWWNQYILIPWPDTLAVFVSANIHGLDDHGRLMRRTIMRYACLCLTITMGLMSPRVKKRFPSYDHLVEGGLMLENEKKVFEKISAAFPKYPKHWLPIVWAASLITRARREGRIRDDYAVQILIKELNTIRGQCGVLMLYDMLSLPLVYTQVVTLAVYTYFLCAVIGRQWLGQDKGSHQHFEDYIDSYFPIFTTLQFFFYMGWLKVAETLINPFGDDDDDFEMNKIIDRNLQMSYLIVDEMHNEHPDLVKDQYWDEVFPIEIPYDPTIKRDEPPEHSTAYLEPTVTSLHSQYDQSKVGTSELEESLMEEGRYRGYFKPGTIIKDSEDIDEEGSAIATDSSDDFKRLKAQRQQAHLLRQRLHYLTQVENVLQISAEQEQQQVRVVKLNVLDSSSDSTVDASQPQPEDESRKDK